MRIGLDARMLGKLGIGTYVNGLLQALPHVLSDDDRLIVFTPPSGQPQARSLLAGAGNVEIRPTPGRFQPVRDQVELAWQFRAASLDVLHVPHYNEPLTSFEKTVVTIHDLIPLLYPSLFSMSRRAIVRLQLGRTLSRARAVIVPSVQTSLDLQRRLGVAASRITVIPEAADHMALVENDATRQWMNRQGVHPPYLFYGGQLKPYKNVSLLVEAVTQLLPRYPMLRLVIGGGQRVVDPSLQRQLRRLGDRVSLVGWIPEGIMPAVLGQAAVSVFPSEYEGFGLPVLEAMAVGVPVVCARASAIPEVAGSAAEYWEPETGATGLVDAIARALEPERAEQLRAAGRLQARRFSWHATARQTYAVYCRAARTNPDR